MSVRTIDAAGLEFAYVQHGENGPLALCLHGFPDTAITWRHLLPRLAAIGFRAVAPYTRGYAPTAIPADGVYQPGALANDVLALHDALGGDTDAIVIGHDWGALAAYGAAAHEPDRWRAVVGIAVPPGGAMAAAFLTDLDQLQRSWYMFLFQHPLAEMVVGANDFAFIDRLWAQWSPGYTSDRRAEDLARVRAALADPEHLRAALGYYRSTIGDGARDPQLEEVQAATGALPPQPTLYLHGRDDGCVGVSVAESAQQSALEAGAHHLTVDIVDGAGHFLHLEQPDAVNERILEFVK